MKKTVFIVSALISFNAFATNEGWKNCDDDGVANCEYQIKDGVLTVRPQDNSQPASIPDYERDCTQTRYAECTTPAPWRWDEDASTVTTLKIESGITSVGSDAFEDMRFTTAQLPDTLTSIGSSAFKECDFLSDINLPNSLKQISDGALAGTALKNVVIPDGSEDNPTIVEAETFRGRNYATVNGVSNIVQELETLVIGENVEVDPKALYTSIRVPDFNVFKMYCSEGNTSCIEALEATFYEAQTRGLVDFSKEASEYLTTYTKDGNGFYQIDDKLYATADLMTHNAACDDAANCQAILNAASQGKPFEVGGKYYATLDLFANGAACTDKKNCEDILSSNGNPFKVGSKIYNSMADFANGNYVKHRIYTIEEANFVAGPVNRVSIKYR